MRFGEKVYTLRKRIGWSQEELAFQLGVRRQTVSKWETDFMKPEIDKVVALSKLFNVSTDTLLIDEIELPPVKADAVCQDKGNQELPTEIVPHAKKRDRSLMAGIILSAISGIGIIIIILVSLFSSTAGDVTVIYSTMYMSLKTIFYFLIAMLVIGLVLLMYKFIMRQRKRKKEK